MSIEIGAHAQWNTNPGGAVTIAIAVLRFQGDGGRLALADSGDTDAYLIDDDDRLVLNDSEADGPEIYANASRIIAS